MSSFEFHSLSLAPAIKVKGIIFYLELFIFTVRDFVVELVSVVEFLRVALFLMSTSHSFKLDLIDCRFWSDSLGRKGALHVNHRISFNK